MNLTNFTHALWGLLIQALVALPSLYLLKMPDAWWIGSAAAIGWFVSREHTQRELQLCLARGTTPQKLKWHEGFTGWTLDRYLDCGFPAAACLLLAASM